jgi:hypothetical protein
MRFWTIALAAAMGALTVGTATSGAVAWEARRKAAVVVVGGAASPAFARDAPSNILPGDYVGPEACSDCHEENYEAWQEHPHRRMNQMASEETVLGDFDDASVALGRVTARFEHAPGEDYTVTLEGGGAPRRAYRITRTIGVRVKQFYAGVLIEGDPVGTNGVDDEVVVPFGWWIAQRRWMPITYFDPYGDGAGTEADTLAIPDGTIRSGCAYCHNTLPYLFRLGVDNTQLRGFHDRDLSLDTGALRGAIAGVTSLERLPGFPPGIQQGFDVTSQLVTVGISCESCHFGTRAHAEEKSKYRFGPSAPSIDLRPATAGQAADRTKDNPWIVNGICRQCHASVGSFYADGSSTENSRESLELERGACASKIACTDCHDPHEKGPDEEAGPDDPLQVAACTRCHAAFASDATARTHARHAPAQASCLDCHMPRITQGMNHALRSHRISIPVDPRMLATGAPNACNVCHTDRSPAWTIAELAKGWNRVVTPEPAWAAAWKGSLDTTASDAWMASPDEHARLVLIEALGRKHDTDSMRRLASLLDDPAGTTRAFAAMAIGRRVGRWLGPEELDVMAPQAERRAQLATLVPKLTKERR